MRGCNYNSIMFCALATDMKCIQDYPVNFRRVIITHFAIHSQASVPDSAYKLLLLVPVCLHRGGQDFKLQAAVSAAGSHSCKDPSAGAEACDNAFPKLLNEDLESTWLEGLPCTVPCQLPVYWQSQKKRVHPVVTAFACKLKPSASPSQLPHPASSHTVPLCA